MHQFDRAYFEHSWAGAQIRPQYLNEMKVTSNRLVNYRATYYDPVEKATGIPWWLVAALDCRESSCNHTRYLGNGDPLWERTRHVPAGRGPFHNWYEGAIDSLRMKRVNVLPAGEKWDVIAALMKADAWNGLGYDHMGFPSPYVWALTNQQRPGKYTADGHFDPHIMDIQPGVAAIFLALREWHGVELKVL